MDTWTRVLRCRALLLAWLLPGLGAGLAVTPAAFMLVDTARVSGSRDRVPKSTLGKTSRSGR